MASSYMMRSRYSSRNFVRMAHCVKNLERCARIMSVISSHGQCSLASTSQNNFLEESLSCSCQHKPCRHCDHGTIALLRHLDLDTLGPIVEDFIWLCRAEELVTYPITHRPPSEPPNPAASRLSLERRGR